MANKIIRVAVLGQGRSGHGIHIKWLREPHARSQYKVVAIADLMPERREAAAEFEAKAYGDYREVLADKSLNLDLVVNALPSHLHPEGTIAALSAGYNVLCEKPAAVRVADFDKMVATAKQNNRTLYIFQNSRFWPAFSKIQELLASGKLGRLICARINFSGFGRRWDWQASQDYWGGNLNNTGPHPLDQAIILFGLGGGGESSPKVFSKFISANPTGDAENFATVTLHGDQATMPVVEVVTSSFMGFPQGGIYHLQCTCGSLAGDQQQLKWKYFDPETAPARTALPTAWSDNRTYNSEKLNWIEDSWSASVDDTNNGFAILSKGLYDNLYEVLVNGAEPIIKLAQVRRQIEVLEETHRQNPLPRRPR